MEENNNSNAILFLQTLVDKTLSYGLKSMDTDLYDFGFINVDNVASWCGEGKESCTHFLHATCRFEVICKNGERRVDRYYEDTPCEEFHTNVQHLLGLKVKRVALSEKNDLWLDFGNYWIVFATFENCEESWRFFSSDRTLPHLVASDCWISLSG